MKIITFLSASLSLLAGAGTAVAQAVPVDAFYCPLKPHLLGACCEKYVEAETVGHYCHEALELYSLVTNTTSQWVCESENPDVVYTDLCCINPNATIAICELPVPHGVLGS